jgi:chromosome segregation ATPase
MKISHLSVLAAFVFLGSVTGCDPSKEELEKTKTQLTSVTAERDGLKGQLDQANAKATALQAQVTDLTAKLAAASAAPPAAPVAEEKAPAKHAAAHKANTAKPLNTDQKKEMEAHPEARKGAGHFN